MLLGGKGPRACRRSKFYISPYEQEGSTEGLKSGWGRITHAGVWKLG